MPAVEERPTSGPYGGSGHRSGHSSGLVIPLPTPCQLYDMGDDGSPGGGTTAANTSGRSSDEDRQLPVNHMVLPRAAREVHKSAPCKPSGGYMEGARGLSEDTTAGDSWCSDTDSSDDLSEAAALQSSLEWANSDPPIPRPENYSRTKLFLPVPVIGGMVLHYDEFVI